MRRKGWCCKAVLSQDAPFAIAIGACILSSLVFQTTPTKQDDDDDDDQDSDSPVIDADDTRFAVMGIISFIPYFNWLVSPFSFSTVCVCVCFQFQTNLAYRRVIFSTLTVICTTMIVNLLLVYDFSGLNGLQHNMTDSTCVSI